jgi:hypothetical protein
MGLMKRQSYSRAIAGVANADATELDRALGRLIEKGDRLKKRATVRVKVGTATGEGVDSTVYVIVTQGRHENV